MNRRDSLALIASLVLFVKSSRSQSSGPLILVFKTPTCSCCGKWVEHLKASTDGNPDLARVLAQATRELLLLQASDWQFLITTGAARDYAERRVAEHYANFKRLSEIAASLRGGEPLSVDAANTLRRLEREDFVFPDLDPAWAQPPAQA